mgnify:FL=1
MKVKCYFGRFVHMCMVAMTACMVGCSDNDEPVVPQPPTPDPDNGEVSFVIDNENGSGTGTTDSPAEVEKGETLNMVISQKSKYTDSDGSVLECEPKATIELFAKLDTVYVKDKNQLTSVQEKPEVTSSQSGTNPIRNAINQKFLIGEQYVNFDLAYEIYNYVNKAEETIEMPYIKVNQANFGSSNANEETPETKARSETLQPVVTLKALPQTRATVSDTVLYEVNVRFNLDIESMNAKTENKQTLAFSVNYLGAVVTTTDVPDPEPELVKVEYRTDYIWEEAHDNLPLLYYAIVYRDRYYRHSDGREEILTDRFVDNGHPVELVAGLIDISSGDDAYRSEGEYFYPDGSSVIFHKGKMVGDNNDSIHYTTSIVEMDNPEGFTIKDDYAVEQSPGTWEIYVVSKLYANGEYIFISPTESFTEHKYETVDLQSGWYFQRFVDKVDYATIQYTPNPDFRKTLYHLQLFIGLYDQFLVIDGRRIDFLNYQPERTFNSRIENLPAAHGYGAGKRVTREIHAKFLGRNFYAACIMEIYKKGS